MTESYDDAAAIGAALRSFVDGDGFSCVGAKMAVQRGTLLHQHYGELGDSDIGRQLHEDLLAFALRREEIDRHFATFVATFAGPLDCDEQTFERLLWRRLQQLHDLDGGTPMWHPDFDPSPESDRFGFCLGGHPFFIVGMHPGASRLSRRFSYPVLAFNSHEQFERLHQMGIFRRLRTETRRRELALQGSVNPSFVDYPGHEARQYAGRETEPDWVCAFRPRPTTTVSGRSRSESAVSARQPTNLATARQVRCARTKLVMLWSDAGLSLLDLCEQYAVPVDSLCRSGVCGRCSVRVLAGQTEYQLAPLADHPLVTYSPASASQQATSRSICETP